MPDYNKKSFSKKTFKSKKTKKFTTALNDDTEDIFMSEDLPKKPKKQPKEQKSFKVVNGRKKLNELRKKVFLAIAAFIIVISLVSVLLSPVSVFESLGNISAAVGIGNFPVNAIGNETKEVYKHGNTFFVLTDTAVECYSIHGKKIFSDLHGSANPVLVNSPSRVLVYEQGGNTVNVYSASGKKLSISTENSIYCAGISKSGRFAIATSCDGYTSMFTVYDKKGNVVFSWYCPDMLINSIILSQNGKKAAVSMLCADNGNILSKVSVFDFSGSSPLTTIDFPGKTVYNMYCNSGSGFGILLNDTYKFVKWNKFTTTDSTFTYEPMLSHSYSAKTVISSCVGSDLSNNYFTVLKSNGKPISSFSLAKPVDDFAIIGNNLFVLSNTQVLLLDNTGNILNTAECDFGVVKLVPVNSKTVLGITDNRVDKIIF